MKYSSWKLAFRRFSRRLLFRTAMFSVLAILTAAAALFLDPVIPEGWAVRIGASAVDSVLTILASSMLAVTTFSLSSVVSAYGAAASNATPRATQLLVTDTSAQNMLAVFIGAFVYSMTALILLKTGVYGTSGVIILFIVSIGVIILIVAVLIRWIDFLIAFGSLTTIVTKLENATREALQSRRAAPFLGGVAMQPLPASAVPVFSKENAYVQHVDMSALNELAGIGRIFVLKQPGSFVHPGEPIAMIDARNCSPKQVAEAFVIGSTRSFDQDPRLGIIALSEVASRALSLAMNDPGTAVDVIGRLVRLLGEWGATPTESETPYLHVYVEGLATPELVHDAFAPIARDGARFFEVHARLQKGLAALAQSNDEGLAKAAREFSGHAMDFACIGLASLNEKEELKRIASGINKPVGRPR